jgi:hypothetical protein
VEEQKMIHCLSLIDQHCPLENSFAALLALAEGLALAAVAAFAAIAVAVCI